MLYHSLQMLLLLWIVLGLGEISAQWILYQKDRHATPLPTIRIVRLRESSPSRKYEKRELPRAALHTGCSNPTNCSPVSKYPLENEALQFFNRPLL